MSSKSDNDNEAIYIERIKQVELNYSMLVSQAQELEDQNAQLKRQLGEMDGYVFQLEASISTDIPILHSNLSIRDRIKGIIDNVNSRYKSLYDMVFEYDRIMESFKEKESEHNSLVDGYRQEIETLMKEKAYLLDKLKLIQENLDQTQIQLEQLQFTAKEKDKKDENNKYSKEIEKLKQDNSRLEQKYKKEIKILQDKVDEAEAKMKRDYDTIQSEKVSVKEEKKVTEIVNTESTMASTVRVNPNENINDHDFFIASNSLPSDDTKKNLSSIENKTSSKGNEKNDSQITKAVSQKTTNLLNGKSNSATTVTNAKNSNTSHVSVKNFPERNFASKQTVRKPKSVQWIRPDKKTTYFEVHQEIESTLLKLKPVYWYVIYAMGAFGVSTREDITDKIANVFTIRISPSEFTNFIPTLEVMGILVTHSIPSARSSNFHAYELTRKGLKWYSYLFDDELMPSEVLRMKKDHDNVEHGYFIKETKKVLQEIGYHNVTMDRLKNTIPLGDRQWIPDIVCESPAGQKIYIEVEHGNHTQNDMDDKINKSTYVTKELYFIVKDNEAQKVISEQISRWYFSEQAKGLDADRIIFYLSNLRNLAMRKSFVNPFLPVPPDRL